MKQTSIEALNVHLFEAIEGLKNNTDPRAEDSEKISVETAKAIADLAQVVINGYKVKYQFISLLARSTDFDPVEVKKLMAENDG
jgi:hypothetical protein